MRYPILALIRSEIDQGVLNCWSPLHDFEVRIGRFQIKQNVLNLKSTLKETHIIPRSGCRTIWDIILLRTTDSIFVACSILHEKVESIALMKI